MVGATHLALALRLTLLQHTDVSVSRLPYCPWRLSLRRTGFAEFKVQVMFQKGEEDRTGNFCGVACEKVSKAGEEVH
jgi:hypothetical protein